MPAALKPGLLTGVGITFTGSASTHTTQRLEQLGATDGTDVLVHTARPPTNAQDVQDALNEAWDAIRATKLPPRPVSSSSSPRRPGTPTMPRPAPGWRTSPALSPSNGRATTSARWRSCPGVTSPPSPSSSPSSRRRPARITPAARSRFASPGHLDGVLRRRVPRHDVLRRLGLGPVDHHVGLTRRDVEHVAGLDRHAVLQVVAPLDLDAAGEHVERALAVRVVVRARLGSRRDAEAAHEQVRGFGGRLGDLGSPDHPARRVALFLG